MVIDTMAKIKQKGCEPTTSLKRASDGPPVSEIMPMIDHIREQRLKVEKMLDGIDE